jgi:hypothetical protein
MPSEVVTAVIAAASAFGGGALGVWGAMRVEMKRLDAGWKSAQYERRLDAMRSFVAAAENWIDLMMTAAMVSPDDKDQKHDLVRKANEYSFQLRDQEAYVSLLVDDALATWLFETFLPAQSTISTLFVRKMQSAQGSWKEIGAEIDRYRDVLAELKKRFREELRHAHP